MQVGAPTAAMDPTGLLGAALVTQSGTAPTAIPATAATARPEAALVTPRRGVLRAARLAVPPVTQVLAYCDALLTTCTTRFIIAEPPWAVPAAVRDTATEQLTAARVGRVVTRPATAARVAQAVTRPAMAVRVAQAVIQPAMDLRAEALATAQVTAAVVARAAVPAAAPIWAPQLRRAAATQATPAHRQ